MSSRWPTCHYALCEAKGEQVWVFGSTDQFGLISGFLKRMTDRSFAEEAGERWVARLGMSTTRANFFLCHIDFCPFYFFVTLNFDVLLFALPYLGNTSFLPSVGQKQNENSEILFCLCPSY
jgi:hypothetical protein